MKQHPWISAQSGGSDIVVALLTMTQATYEKIEDNDNTQPLWIFWMADGGCMIGGTKGSQGFPTLSYYPSWEFLCHSTGVQLNHYDIEIDHPPFLLEHDSTASNPMC
jgi:hypothetical protein